VPRPMVAQLSTPAPNGYVGGCAKAEVALRDELPSASVLGRVRGCRLAARHGPGPAVPAALDPVCGMSGSFCTVRRQIRVSAETACESVHKAVPRNSYERGGHEHHDQGRFPVGGMRVNSFGTG
jgi:hypothetical protein